MQPREHGGSELGWDIFCQVIQVLAAGCGAQAWVYRVLGDHAKMIGTFSAEAQEDVWGRNKDTLVSSSFAPVGRAIPEPGGYRYTGAHSFSSGIDHSDWVICGGMIDAAKDDLSKGPHFFLVHKRECTVVDDWHVIGLEGTGSKSFKVENAFVPAHRVLSVADSMLGRGPGTRTNSAPIFRLPRFSYTSSGFSAVMLGMARGLFEDWLPYIATKKSEGKIVAGQEHVQIIVGETGARIDAAERLYLPIIQKAMRTLERGETLPEVLGLESRRNNSYACQIALSVANGMYQTTGGRGVYKGNSMERQFRNILTASQHVSINWPSSAAGYGIHLLKTNGAQL